MTNGRTWAELYKIWWATAKDNYGSDDSKKLAQYYTGGFVDWADANSHGADSLADLVALYLAQLTNKITGEELSKVTRHNHFRQIQTMLNALRKRGKLSVEVDLLEFKQPRKKKPDWYSPEEQKAILAADHGPRDNLLSRLLLETGLRLSEALWLNWEWISFDQDRGIGTAWVPREFTKGKIEERRALFTKLTWDALNEYRDELLSGPNPDRIILETVKISGEDVEVTPIFIGTRGSPFKAAGRLSRRGGSHIFTAMGKRLGFHIHAHKFRHSCGRNMAVAGIPQQAGMKQLGHRTADLWLHYSDLGQEEHEMVWERMVVNAD